MICLQLNVIDYGAGDSMWKKFLYKLNKIEIPHNEIIAIISATHDIKQSLTKDEYNLPLIPSYNKPWIFNDDDIYSNLIRISKTTKAGCAVNFNENILI